MKIIDGYRLARGNLNRTKIRSFLTIGGVVVSVASIVLLVSLGTGLQLISVNKIASINALTRLNVMAKEGGSQKITEEVVQSVQKTPHVEFVSRELQFPARVTFMDAQGDSLIQALDADYLGYSDINLISGKSFDNNSADQIVVSKAVLKLFGKENDPGGVIGKEMELEIFTASSQESISKKVLATIVGTTEDENITYIYMPLSAFTPTESKTYNAMTIKVDKRENVKVVKSSVDALGFQSTSVSSLVDQIDQAFLWFQIILGAIGGIALFVAGIGIVNTMTISLLERTHEIGIMKAIGAKDRDVKNIFTYEAAIIGFAGGGLGVSIGWLFGILVNAVVSLFLHSSGQDAMQLFVMPLNFAIFTLLLSTLLAILAGVYPARRAAKLSPLQALKYQ